jgi:hypothetical protein
MEVGGAALGLAAVHLGRVRKRLAMVGDQSQVAGDRPTPAPHDAWQVSGEGGPEATVEFLSIGELSRQVPEDGVAIGGIEQPQAGIRQGREALGGAGQDGTDRRGGTAADGWPGPEDRGQPREKQLLHLRGGQDTLTRSHG